VTAPEFKQYTCNRHNGPIPALETHLRLTVTMVTGDKTVQRYCTSCCADPELAILFADVCNNPVKHMEVFMCYR
jgi:hypothetical protein